MKKRKFPVLLVTAIVVLVGSAAVYNIYNTRTANMTPEQAGQEAQRQAMETQRQNAPKSDAPRAIPGKDELRGAVQAGINKGRSATENGPGGRPAGPGGPSSGPSILAPETKPYKPTPNDSATSSQWFNKK